MVDDATPPIKPPPLPNFYRVELVDFLGIDDFDLIFLQCLVDIVNSRSEINLVQIAYMLELKFLKPLSNCDTQNI